MSIHYDYRVIDQATWARRRHFELYKKSNHPYAGLSANIDVTSFLDFCRRRDLKFFHAFLYFLGQQIKAADNFRYRLHQGEVILFESVDLGYTAMDPGDELFYFAVVEKDDDLWAFHDKSIAAARAAIDGRCLDNPRLDMVYVTNIPWLSFTDIIQPLSLSPTDSIPRVALGRRFRRHGRVLMPLSVLGHHGFIDGFHLARFINELAESLERFSIC